MNNNTDITAAEKILIIIYFGDRPVFSLLIIGFYSKRHHVSISPRFTIIISSYIINDEFILF